jgi:hypothetical protein
VSRRYPARRLPLEQRRQDVFEERLPDNIRTTVLERVRFQVAVPTCSATLTSAGASWFARWPTTSAGGPESVPQGVAREDQPNAPRAGRQLVAFPRRTSARVPPSPSCDGAQSDRHPGGCPAVTGAPSRSHPRCRGRLAPIPPAANQRHGEPEMVSIVGNVYDDTDLACDPPAREVGSHRHPRPGRDLEMCPGPQRPQRRPARADDQGVAVRVLQSPGRRLVLPRRHLRSRLQRHRRVPSGRGTAPPRPVIGITESRQRWHVPAGGGHWHPALELPCTVMDRVLPDHVRVAARVMQTIDWRPEDEPTG